MHDAKGRPLKEGDIVLIPAVVTDLSATEEYCNVSVETIFGRRPDAQKERVYAINTGVLLRANHGDENALCFDEGRPVPHHGSGPDDA